MFMFCTLISCLLSGHGLQDDKGETYLESSVHDHNSLVQLLLCFEIDISAACPGLRVWGMKMSATHHIRDDARQQQVLLVLVRALLLTL